MFEERRQEINHMWPKKERGQPVTQGTKGQRRKEEKQRSTT